MRCEAAPGSRAAPWRAPENWMRPPSMMCARLARPECHGHELLDQQHADPRLGDLANRRDQPVDDHRREAQRQLVDQDVLRLRDERLGEHHHLLLASRQRPSGCVQALLQLWEQLERACPPRLRLVSRKRVRGHLDVVLHRQLRQQPASLGDDRNSRAPDALRPLAREVGAAQLDRALRRPQDAADRKHEAGLTRSVRSEQRRDLAGRDLDVHLAHDRAAAALDGQPS